MDRATRSRCRHGRGWQGSAAGGVELQTLDSQSKGGGEVSRGTCVPVSHPVCLLPSSSDAKHSAGDAAHSFPPTGGLGLNCGLADVHNLAFKLAAVHAGEAGAEVLQTYDAERRPVADIYSRQSAENGKKIFSFLKRLGTAGVEDDSLARARLRATMHDPTKQAEIAEGVEEQREHFDNVSW